MPEAFPLLPLLGFLAFAVTYVLAQKSEQILRPIFDVVNKAIGFVPFVGGWVKSATNHVLVFLNELVKEARGAMTTFWQAFLWSIRETVAAVETFAGFVASGWAQLTGSALPGAFAHLYADAAALSASVGRRVDTLTTTVADNLAAAKHYAEKQATGALTDAGRYTDAAISKLHSTIDTHVTAVYTEIEGDLTRAKTDAIQAAEGYADTLKRQVESDIAAAKTTAADALAGAVTGLNAAIQGVRDALTAAQATLEGEVAAAEQAASSALAAKASELVAQIAAAEQAAEQAAASALTGAETTLNKAVADARTAAASALASAQTTIRSDISAASTAAATALASTASDLRAAITTVSATAAAIGSEITGAEAAAAGELTDIYNLPVDEIRRLLDRIDLTKIAGFGAGVVLLRGLVETIAKESGLDSSQCRAKNKQICATDPLGWTKLLAGAALLTGALSLRELVVPARAVFKEAEHLIEAAA